MVLGILYLAGLALAVYSLLDGFGWNAYRW